MYFELISANDYWSLLIRAVTHWPGETIPTECCSTSASISWTAGTKTTSAKPKKISIYCQDLWFWGMVNLKTLGTSHQSGVS